MTDWPAYESHKSIKAARIVRLVGKPDAAGEVRVSEIQVQPTATSDPEAFWPTNSLDAETAKLGDYAVELDTGHKFILDKTDFEDEFSPALPVPPPPSPEPEAQVSGPVESASTIAPSAAELTGGEVVPIDPPPANDG
jgi:hypothetical protein